MQELMGRAGDTTIPADAATAYCGAANTGAIAPRNSPDSSPPGGGFSDTGSFDGGFVMAARSPMPEPVAAGSSTRSCRRPQSQEAGRLWGWSILGAFPLPQIGAFSAALALGLILVVAGAPALVLLPLAAAGAVAGGLVPRIRIDNAPADNAVADNAAAGAERLGEAVSAPRWKPAGAVHPMGRGGVGAPAADCRAVPEERAAAPAQSLERAAAPAQSLEPPAVRLGDPAPWLNTGEATAPLGLYREQEAPEPAIADGAGRVGGARPPERCLRPVPPPPDDRDGVQQNPDPAVGDGAGRVGGRPPERGLRPVPPPEGRGRVPPAARRCRSRWGRRCAPRGGRGRVPLTLRPAAGGGRVGGWRSGALAAPGDGERGTAASGVITCSRWVGFSGGGRAGPVAATAVCAGDRGQATAAAAAALALGASRRPGLPVDSGGSAHAGGGDRDPGLAGTAAGAVCSAGLGGLVMSILAAVFVSRSPGGGANSRRGHCCELPFHQP